MTKKIICHLYILLILPVVAIHGRTTSKHGRSTAKRITTKQCSNTTTNAATETIMKNAFSLTENDLETETEESTTTMKSTQPQPSTDGRVVRFHGPDDFFHPQPNTTHNASVFFLHGLGNDGSWMKEWITIVQDSVPSLPHIKVIFPTAPARTSKYLWNQVRNIWFDRDNNTCNETEDLESMLPSLAGLSGLIISEVKSGISPKKIIIGGYASGGAMAFHVAYRYFPQIAGVFGIHSFLASNSSVFQEIRKNQTEHLPKAYLLAADGTAEYDQATGIWVRETARELAQLGVEAELAIVSKSEMLGQAQLKDLWRWITETLA